MVSEGIATRLRRAELRYMRIASDHDIPQIKKKWEACAKTTTLLGEHTQSSALANGVLEVTVDLSLDGVVRHLRRRKFGVGESAVRKYLGIISNDTNSVYVLRDYKTRLYVTR